VLAVAALMAILAVASMLAGIPRLAFLDVPMAHGIPAFDLSVQDADAETAAAQRVDRHSSKKTAIFTAAHRIISARPADASLWPTPKTTSSLVRSAQWLSTCCASASRYAGSVGLWSSVSRGCCTLRSTALHPAPITSMSSPR
jgi:hypothetical protein